MKKLFGLTLGLIFFSLAPSVQAITQQQACSGSGCNLKCGICIGDNNCSLNKPAVSNNPTATQNGLPVTHFCRTNSDCTNVFQGVPQPGTTFYGSVKRCGRQVPFGTKMTISNCNYAPTCQVFSSSSTRVNGVYSVYSYTTNTDSIGNWLRDGSLNNETLNFYIKDPFSGKLTWLGRYTYNASETSKQLNWDYCPK